MPFFRLLLVFLTGLLTTHLTRADNPRPYGFRPLEIYPFRHGCDNLRLSDLNQDGRDDVLFVNNRESRLELLIRKKDTGAAPGELPQLEERFEDRGFVLEQALRTLQTGDINLDGAPDLIGIGAALGLQAWHNDGSAHFTPAPRLLVENPALAVDLDLADLDGEQGTDLIVTRRDGVEILWNDGQGRFSSRQHLSLAKNNAKALHVADFNRDGRLDLLMVLDHPELPLRLRLQEPDRAFSPEHPLALPPHQAIDVIPHADEPLVACIFKNGRLFRLYRIGYTGTTAPNGLRPELAPLRIPLESGDLRKEWAWTAGDLLSNGWTDLIAAAPSIGQIHVYGGSAEGWRARPRRLDSLMDVQSLCLTSDGDLAVYSPREKAVALHRRDALEAFPTVFDLPNDPLAIAPGIRPGMLFVLVRSGDEDVRLLHLNTARGEPEGEGTVLPLKNDPQQLLVSSLGGDELGILLFVPYRDPLFFRSKGGVATEVPAGDFRALAEPRPREAFALLAPPSGERLLVASKTLARLYQWQGDAYGVERQINPGRAESDLKGVAVDPRDPNHLALYDHPSSSLLLQTPEASELQRIHLLGGNRAPRGMAILHGPDASTPPTYALAGERDFLLAHPRRRPLQALVAAEYSSMAEEPALRFLRPLKLGREGLPVLGVVDEENRSIELVRLNHGTLDHSLTIEVFHAPALAQKALSRGTQPHDLQGGDIDGDGIQDLALLVHDRLIIYPGE